MERIMKHTQNVSKVCRGDGNVCPWNREGGENRAKLGKGKIEQ